MMRMRTVHWIAIAYAICSIAAAAEPNQDTAATSSKVVSIPEPTCDPGTSLCTARQLFLELDMGSAAAKLRQGSKELRAAAHNSATDVRQSLLEASDELEELSKRVEDRGVKKIEELDKPFARAYHAIALHHLRSGEQHFQLRERAQAGNRLRMAADNLERMASAADHHLSATANEAIRESRIVSSKMIEDAGYATDHVGKSFESLGQHIETAGKHLDPIATQDKRSPQR